MSNELLNPWVFWFFSVPKCTNKDWALCYEQSLVPLCEIKSVEEFFNAYCYLEHASELARNWNLCLFRQGKKPMWESSPDGGCWILRTQKWENETDLYWEKMLMECIRGGFPDEVDGIMASSKANEVYIQIWMSNAHNSQSKIAESIKSCLELSTVHLLLKYHKESMIDMSTFKNAKLVKV